jgi:hypothetical protein
MEAREAGGVAYQMHPSQVTEGIYRGDRLKQEAPGKHVWIISATFLTTVEAIERMREDPKNEMILMDREALALVAGPGCFICEQMYSREVAASPCPGDPYESVKRGEVR